MTHDWGWCNHFSRYCFHTASLQNGNLFPVYLLPTATGWGRERRFWVQNQGKRKGLPCITSLARLAPALKQFLLTKGLFYSTSILKMPFNDGFNVHVVCLFQTEDFGALPPPSGLFFPPHIFVLCHLA